jgi:hypothetical protein
MVELAETIVQERHHSTDYKLTNLVNGYFRQDIYKGNEYIIDGIYNSSEDTISERVKLFRPYAPSIRILPDKNMLNEKIHIIVPVSNANQKCNTFLHMYLQKVVNSNENAHLILVVYRKVDYDKVNDQAKKIKESNNKAVITVIRGKGRFSRAKALHQGMTVLKGSDLVFFCDIDLLTEPHFYNRCRRNTIRGKQVYFPTVMKFYSPKFGGPTKQLHHINRQIGHWASYGYGMVCVYKSDYVHVGGFNIRMRGWGGEDVDFYHRVGRRGLQIFRAPDTGLLHRWHERDCSSKSVRRNMKAQCQYSKLEALGDKRNLAKFIFNFTAKYPHLL